MRLLFKVKNIETSYGFVNAIRGVSLDMEEGDIKTVLGANGAGKTTILKTIMGLLEDQPEKGTIEFMGKRIDRMDTEDIVRLGISYVPEGREIFPELTVFENLKMGSYTRRDKDGVRKDYKRVSEYFSVLEERKNQLAGTLSGGEQQMLAIGRALMARPKLLLLDEPSLGLSPVLVKEIFEIIKAINKEGIAILLVEQNARMALNIGNYGYVLENGRIVLSDETRVLLENDDVKEFYLGVKLEESVKGYQRYKRKKRWR
ncbi:MAG: ABC transporter ATP-binding protein [Deltaproteobacteria bacterium CG12_big_fil_rev_8_21_14_0_65_43_10]|nr:MAG: ABC transporter ATP-binding protein [Deltaproteobacteria bacterium CG2_30_43_15]PIQ45557.1 MAG: ABC transporter ATP-binding protein [Deltaproteobacteria bacterium CG12_big_fil_rev_8_21_14_0_65_43_10]PIU85598.1 MAG: ABC transporter ATP-binding protein [Deltaproteobacteria bacterium CG06_land_8_20_14_3_00_44_19]PIX24346.1 MAG: ABC transporter ATP-binding protein [Deltaproteobacteria bacterium CG_4_8_14_3_um_filter_43_13]PIZ20283.1 MAG: ABC transporter ATP-binding protein [Deltaproteobacte